VGPRAGPDVVEKGKISCPSENQTPAVETVARRYHSLLSLLESIRRDETVSVNKASPASPQLTARSGQSAQFSVLTAFGRTFTCIQTLYTPATVHTSRDRCMIAFQERGRYHVHLFTMTLVSANGLYIVRVHHCTLAQVEHIRGAKRRCKLHRALGDLKRYPCEPLQCLWLYCHFVGPWPLF
jgi:hypothetical protein